MRDMEKEKGDSGERDGPEKTVRGGRSRSRSPSRKHHSRRRSQSASDGGGSSSSSDSDSDSRSDSDSDASDRNSKRKRAKKSSSSSSKKEKKSRKEKKKKKKSKSKDDDRKKKKKSKNKSKKIKRDRDSLDTRAKSGSMNSTYGSHGIITNTDIYSKEAEFRAWLMEVKKISPDALNTKQYFAEYMEDYNTGSLPHEKFYNLDHWESQDRIRKEWMTAVGMGDSDGGETFDLKRDEEMLRMQSKSRVPKGPQLSYSTGQMQELKRVSEERLAADRLRKMGFQPKESLGVRYEEQP
ncbi:hypothetical protein DFJ73DRAFT_850056 [Zopfochytrium polystomum]|nr:hypothetical protein DFJ73DRAFT_850056 [Zopfochytrium polystomum]